MKTYHAHETEAVVQPDGTLRVEGVPFGAGEWVRVVLLSPPLPGPRRHSAEEVERSRRTRQGLRGTVLRYDDPFGPAVPPDEWEAMK